MEFRYEDTYDDEDYTCYVCKLPLHDITHTSYENPSSYDCFTGKSDYVLVHFRLCIPCGDKIRGTKLTEGQKLKRDHMMRLVDAFVKREAEKPNA